MSALKTGILMILIFGIFLGIGSFFGPQGMTIAVVLALVLNLILGLAEDFAVCLESGVGFVMLRFCGLKGGVFAQEDFQFL